MAQVEAPETPNVEATPIERRRLAARLRGRTARPPAPPVVVAEQPEAPAPEARRRGMLGSFRALLDHQPWFAASGIIFGDPPRSRRRDDY